MSCAEDTQDLIKNIRTNFLIGILFFETSLSHLDILLYGYCFGERKPLCRFAASPLKGRKKVLNVDILSPCQGGVPEGRGGYKVM
jgi:hypothetical protein